jgi:hypothetical protein
MIHDPTQYTDHKSFCLVLPLYRVTRKPLEKVAAVDPRPPMGETTVSYAGSDMG